MVMICFSMRAVRCGDFLSFFLQEKCIKSDFSGSMCIPIQLKCFSALYRVCRSIMMFSSSELEIAKNPTSST